MTALGFLGGGFEGRPLLTALACFELGQGGVGRVVGDLAVEALVVEPVDVGHGGELDVVEAAPRTAPADEFGFEQPDVDWAAALS